MARAAVIGEATRTAGYALAGAVVLVAENSDEARTAWRSLPADIAVLVLTARAAAWLGQTPPAFPGHGGLKPCVDREGSTRPDPPGAPPGPSPFTRDDLLVVVMPP